MLCKLQNVKKWPQKAGFLAIAFFNTSAILWAPMAVAQVSNMEQTEGTISGTVLLRTNNRPASQVVVKLKSHIAGIFRSVLTDLEGHFVIRSLPPSTYEIVVDEPGYEPAQASAQLDGSTSPLVLYLNSTTTGKTEQSSYTVSTRELRIPGKAKHEYEKGLGSLAKKDFSGSLSHFAKAAEAFPEYYEAYYHTGVAETTLGHLNEAMQAFQKAIDLSGGKYPWAEIGVGYLFYLEGKDEEAVTVVQRGLEKDDSSADGYFILGLSQLRLNRVDEAEKSAREALLRKTDFADPYLVLADVYGRRREYREQLQGMDSYLKLAPNGAESARVREAREAVLRIVASLRAEN